MKMNDRHSQPARIVIRKPTADLSQQNTAQAFRVDKSLKGLSVGFREDGLWMSWKEVMKVWRAKLEAAGATTHVYQFGEPKGPSQAIRAARDKWITQTDCAIVGLGS